MLNFGASKPRVKGGPGPPGPPLDPHLVTEKSIQETDNLHLLRVGTNLTITYYLQSLFGLQYFKMQFNYNRNAV